MGRKPIGDKPMTPVERQRRRRERLGIGGPWLRSRQPWNNVLADSRRESSAITEIEAWLEYGDKEAVTKWLALWLSGRDDLAELLNDIAAAARAYDDEA